MVIRVANTKPWVRLQGARTVRHGGRACVTESSEASIPSGVPNKESVIRRIFYLDTFESDMNPGPNFGTKFIGQGFGVVKPRAEVYFEHG